MKHIEILAYAAPPCHGEVRVVVQERRGAVIAAVWVHTPRTEVWVCDRCGKRWDREPSPRKRCDYYGRMGMTPCGQLSIDGVLRGGRPTSPAGPGVLSAAQAVISTLAMIAAMSRSSDRWDTGCGRVLGLEVQRRKAEVRHVSPPRPWKLILHEAA